MSITHKHIIEKVDPPVNYDEVAGELFERLYPSLGGQSLEDFLNPSLKHIPDPQNLKGIGQAADLFLKFFHEGKKILIVGDYDVDGITSSSLWVRFFRYLDYKNYAIFIPSRFQHGYGLSQNSLPDILKHSPELIITVDNGITAAEMVAKLKQKNIEVIITDHHNPTEALPDCPIVNPKLPGCEYPEKDITGAGVVFLMLVELRRRFRKLGFWSDARPEPNLSYDLDLVAMGTIADQAPLLGLNRIFTFFGLRQIEQNSRQDNHQNFYSYLTALFKQYPTLQHYNTDNELVAFKISPLLNASGRMGNAMIGVNFLTASSLAEAEALLKKLDRLNKKRIEAQSEMIMKAEVQADEQEIRGAICIYDPSFHEGLTGLVAGRLSIERKVPVIVLADSQNDYTCKGSCRMPAGRSILSILKKCEIFLESYGGHDNAAGVLVKKENLENFRKCFFQMASSEAPDNSAKANEYDADIEIPDQLINEEFYDRIKQMEPHGVGNPRPVFAVKKINLGRQVVTNKNLIKWRLDNDVEAIYWDHEPYKKFYSGMLNLSFEMKRNAYKGKGLQLIIKKIYSA